MKKITLLSVLAAFAFLLFGTMASAQTFNVVFVDRIGPWNITAVVAHSGYNYPVLVRVSKNGNPSNSPVWQPISQDTLFGPGQYSVVLNGLPYNSNGWGGLVRFLTATGSNQLINEGVVFQSVYPLAPPIVNVVDEVYGFAPDLYLRATVVSRYGVGRPNYYVTRLRCKMWATSPVGYEHTEVFTFPMSSSPIAFFNLPFGNYFGSYCFVWWYTDEDTSVDSNFGEIEVWRSDTLCFSLGTTGFSSDRLKAEFTAFPNPFVDMVTVTSPSTTTYSLVSLNGQVVRQGNLMYGDNRMDFGDLTPGLYILQTPLGQTKVVKQ